jgi:hypothetical protein
LKCQKSLRRFSQRLSTANNIADYSGDIVAAIEVFVVAAGIVAGIAEDSVVEGIEDNLDIADTAEAVAGIVAADSSTAIVRCNNCSTFDIEVVFVAAVLVLL